MIDIGIILHELEDKIITTNNLVVSVIQSLDDATRRVVDIKFYTKVALDTINIAELGKRRELAVQQTVRLFDIISKPDISLTIDELELTQQQKDMIYGYILEGGDRV
jgi:hypothetical protein